MKVKSNFVSLLALGGAAVLSLNLSPSLQAAAFTNGSFEINGGNPSPTIPGWTSSSTSTVAYNGEGSTDGDYAVLFNSGQAPSGGIFFQSFTTLPLQTYTLSLDFGAFGGGSTSLSRLLVEVQNGTQTTSGAGAETINAGSGVIVGVTGGSLTTNGTTIQISDSTGAAAVKTPAPNTEFSTLTFTFTAQSTTSTIFFTDQSTGGVDGQDAVLDNVQINAIPEPSSWAMMGIGAGLLGLALRHRRTRLA